jgi:hypothetical protein
MKTHMCETFFSTKINKQLFTEGNIFWLWRRCTRCGIRNQSWRNRCCGSCRNRFGSGCVGWVLATHERRLGIGTLWNSITIWKPWTALQDELSKQNPAPCPQVETPTWTSTSSGMNLTKSVLLRKVIFD